MNIYLRLAYRLVLIGYILLLPALFIGTLLSVDHNALIILARGIVVMSIIILLLVGLSSLKP